jgi:hypothetical protein
MSHQNAPGGAETAVRVPAHHPALENASTGRWWAMVAFLRGRRLPKPPGPRGRLYLKCTGNDAAAVAEAREAGNARRRAWLERSRG